MRPDATWNLLRIFARATFAFAVNQKPPEGGGEYGEGGIRTRGTVARTLDFQSSTLSRSATSPVNGADIV